MDLDRKEHGVSCISVWCDTGGEDSSQDTSGSHVAQVRAALWGRVSIDYPHQSSQSRGCGSCGGWSPYGSVTEEELRNPSNLSGSADTTLWYSESRGSELDTVTSMFPLWVFHLSSIREEMLPPRKVGSQGGPGGTEISAGFQPSGQSSWIWTPLFYTNVCVSIAHDGARPK